MSYTAILLAGDRAGDVLAAQSPGKRKAFEQVVLASRAAAAPAVVQRQTRVTPLLPPQPAPLVEHLLPANETAGAVPLRQAA